jgi:hypothetical protein
LRGKRRHFLRVRWPLTIAFFWRLQKPTSSSSGARHLMRVTVMCRAYSKLRSRGVHVSLILMFVCVGDWAADPPLQKAQGWATRHPRLTLQFIHAASDSCISVGVGDWAAEPPDLRLQTAQGWGTFTFLCWFILLTSATCEGKNWACNLECGFKPS